MYLHNSFLVIHDSIITHRLNEPATHLSTVASKMVPIYPKNENPIKSPKAPPSELNKSMLLNIRTSSLTILSFSVKLKKNKTFVMFLELILISSSLVEYVMKVFCFKHTLAFFINIVVATSFSFDFLHNEL